MITLFTVNKSSRPEVFCRKSDLKNFAKFTGKHVCQSLFIIKLQSFGLDLIFSCEFCKSSENIFSYRIPWVVISV